MKILCKRYDKCPKKHLVRSCFNHNGWIDLENNKTPSCFFHPQQTHETELSEDVISHTIGPYFQNADFGNFRLASNRAIESMTRNQWKRTDTNKHPLRLFFPYKKTQIYCIRHKNLLIVATRKGRIIIKDLSHLETKMQKRFGAPILSLDINEESNKILIMARAEYGQKYVQIYGFDLTKMTTKFFGKLYTSLSIFSTSTAAYFFKDGFFHTDHKPCFSSFVGKTGGVRGLFSKAIGFRFDKLVVLDRNTIVLWNKGMCGFCLRQSNTYTEHLREGKVQYIFKLSSNKFVTIKEDGVYIIWKILDRGILNKENTETLQVCGEGLDWHKTAFYGLLWKRHQDGSYVAEKNKRIVRDVYWKKAVLYRNDLVLCGQFWKENKRYTILRIFNVKTGKCEVEHKSKTEEYPTFMDIYNDKFILVLVNFSSQLSSLIIRPYSKVRNKQVGIS